MKDVCNVSRPTGRSWFFTAFQSTECKVCPAQLLQMRLITELEGLIGLQARSNNIPGIYHWTVGSKQVIERSSKFTILATRSIEALRHSFF